MDSIAIPEHVVAYAAGILTVVGTEVTVGQIADLVAFAGLGRFEPETLMHAAAAWIKGHVSEDVQQMAKRLRRLKGGR